MKFSNFKMIKEPVDWKDSSPVIAEVDVEKGFWPFKKSIERVKVFKDTVYWQFMDTGKYTPGNKVETLASAYKAKQILKEE